MEVDYDPDISLRGIGERRRMLFDSLKPKAQTSKKKDGPPPMDEDSSNNSYNLRSSTKKRKCTSDKFVSSAKKIRSTAKYYDNVECTHNDKKNIKQRNKNLDNAEECASIESAAKKDQVTAMYKIVKQRNETSNDADFNDENLLDFDSDDSVKDKDYSPEEISLTSNSSGQSIQELSKIETVKRKLFTPEKLQETYVRQENDFQDLITITDLLGSQALVPYYKFPLRILLNKINVQKPPYVKNTMSIDFDGVIRFDEQQNLESNSLASGSTRHPETSNSSKFCLDKSSDFSNCQALVPYCKYPFRMLLNNLDVQKPVIEPMDTESTVMLRQDEQQDPEIVLSVNEQPVSPQTNDQLISPEVPGQSSDGRSRKRQRNKESWIRVRSKNARLKGSPYTSSVAKKKVAVEARQLKPPCSCRAKCTQHISEFVRNLIFNNFWKTIQSWDQRRQYVVSCTQKKIKGTMKTGANIENDRRKYTYVYSLVFEEKRIKVCKKMFLNTLCISEKFLVTSLAKTLESGMVEPDQRGKHTPGNKTPTPVTESIHEHISSYPCYESHYTRNKTQKKYLGPELNLSIMYRQYVELMKEKEVEPKMIAKEWLYRHVFNTQFNLSFKLPGVDTCDECDSLQRKLKDATTDEEKTEILNEKKSHEDIAQKRYDLKAADKENSINSSGKTKTVMFDLQKCLPTPCLTNSKSFYLRKLWTLNLTVYDSTEKKASNMVWSENTSGRGGNEIASCLIRWAQENLGPAVEEITFWSDNCAGQNRNSMVIMAFIWILGKFPNLKVINHKYLLKGHTHMEVDHIHSIIERKKKLIPTMEIAVTIYSNVRRKTTIACLRDESQRFC